MLLLCGMDRFLLKSLIICLCIALVLKRFGNILNRGLISIVILQPLAPDYLSNGGCKEERFVCFDNCNIPRKLSGILRLNRSGLANIQRMNNV